jgi:hypothetical protein
MASIINASSTGSGGIVQTADASGVLQLQSNGTTALTVSGSTAQVATTIGVGGATPSASGAGITFPATQSASSDANTLDDYEEGTWTPAMTFSGGNTGIVYTSQIGRYTKIGNMVSVFMSIGLSSKGSSTGGLSFGGFPFSSVNTGNPVSAIYGALTGISSQLIPYLSGTTITVEQINTGSQSPVTNSQVLNNSSFFFSMTYQVS